MTPRGYRIWREKKLELLWGGTLLEGRLQQETRWSSCIKTGSAGISDYTLAFEIGGFILLLFRKVPLENNYCSLMALDIEISKLLLRLGGAILEGHLTQKKYGSHSLLHAKPQSCQPFRTYQNQQRNPIQLTL